MSFESDLNRRSAAPTTSNWESVTPLKDNWVYVSNERADVATLEQNSRSPDKLEQISTRYRNSRSCPGSDWSEDATRGSILNQSSELYHAGLLLNEISRIHNQYRHSRQEYWKLCCNLSTTATARTIGLRNCVALSETEAEVADSHFQQHLESLKQYSQALDTTEDKLSVLLSKIQGIESLSAKHLDDDQLRSNDESFEPSDVSDTSSNGPSELEDYFDKAGEVFVVKDRLADLEQEFDEHRQHVQWRCEANDHSATSGTIAEERYAVERQRLLAELAVAESELSTLRQACLRRGIEPEHARYRRMSERNEKPVGLFSDYCTNLVSPIRLIRDAVSFNEANQGDSLVV